MIFEERSLILFDVEKDPRAVTGAGELRGQLRILNRCGVIIEPIEPAGCRVKAQKIVIEMT